VSTAGAAAAQAPDLKGIDCEVVAVESPDLPRMGWGLTPARGIYYRPSGAAPRTAFIATHYNLDFSQHYLADLLAHRGYGFLGWNTRFCGREGFFLLDRALLDLGLGVRWLRDQGVETVVLVGNSGGGSLMAAYDAQSRQSVIRPAYGTDLADGLDELPAGDLYISLAAHPGRPEVLTNWLDPAVVDEFDPVKTDPSVDMYDRENGPPYSPEFVSRYRAAQKARNRRITEWAKQELERVEAAGYQDRLFTLQRTWADLRFVDPALDPSDRPTPACYRGDPETTNRGADGIGTLNTLRTWLSMWSLDESQCLSSEYLGLIDTPALVVQATRDSGVFPSDARAIFEGLATTNKQLLEMPGDHYFRGPGSPRTDVAEVLVEWVREQGAH
jgi:pimeloyl-ACP methyl ester carboxylesterase